MVTSQFSFRRGDILVPEGFREDGRLCSEHRGVSCRVSLNSIADGSALFASGSTKVVAQVHGPVELKNPVGLKEKCTCNVEVFYAPFARNDRRLGRSGRAELSMGNQLREILESVIVPDRYLSSQVLISVLVLEADGSEKITAINACSLALVDAGIAIKGPIAAVSVAIFKEESLLIDLTSREEQAGLPSLQYARCGGATVLLASESSASTNQIIQMSEKAREATDRIEKVQRKALLDISDRRVNNKTRILAHEVKEEYLSF